MDPATTTIAQQQSGFHGSSNSLDDFILSSLANSQAATQAAAAGHQTTKKGSNVLVYVLGGLALLIVVLVLASIAGGGGTTPPPASDPSKRYTCTAYTCVEDEQGYYPSLSACQAECAESCNSIGSYGMDFSGTCQCKPGYAGPKCSTCADGLGPKFPCCSYKEIPWNGINWSLPLEDQNLSNVKLSNMCEGQKYNSSSDTAASEAWRCVTPATGCLTTPTFNYSNHSGGTTRRARCDYWIDNATNRPVGYGGGTQSKGEYEANLATLKANHRIRPGRIFCRSQPPGSVSYEEFSSECVAENFFTCNYDGGQAAYLPTRKPINTSDIVPV